MEVTLEVVVYVGRVLDVGQVEVRLEHRDEREVEREGEEDRERDDHRIRRQPLTPGHETWALRAKKSIATLTTIRSGKRKSEIAAPSPSDPESIPTA